ncbi:MAG TPA: hypothetical protein VFQ43_14970, partial [Nitrososphaera sp.]|nr:hypothetical protein [Nitrososphaera sp.]
KAGVPRWVSLLSYAAMILHPASQFNRYTMADTFYAAILPLTLGGLLLTLLTPKLIHAAWTGIALAALWNTREESFLIPPLLIVFFLLAVIRQRSMQGGTRSPLARRSRTKAASALMLSWKATARDWLKPAAAMVGILLSLNLTIDLVNYRTFRSFSKSDISSPGYEAAFRALLRIKPAKPLRFVPVTTEAMQVAYTVSPAFAQLRAQLEGDLGRAWQVPTFTTLGIHEMGPWFMWGFRQAANFEGFHKDAVSANRYYRQVASEINQACDQDQIPCRLVFSSFLDPSALSNIAYLPQSLVRTGGLFVLPYHRIASQDDDILTDSQRALYDEMTNRRVMLSPGFSDQSWNFIGEYHWFLVLGLSIAGLVALLIILWRFRYVQVSDSVNSVLILLGTTILLRFLFFSFLDATWWEGGYERYLFPIMPFYSCFLILLIYQSLVLWRKGGKAI